MSEFEKAIEAAFARFERRTLSAVRQLEAWRDSACLAFQERTGREPEPYDQITQADMERARQIFETCYRDGENI